MAGNYKTANAKACRQSNGNHAYIDYISEQKKVLVNEFVDHVHSYRKHVKRNCLYPPCCRLPL